MIIDRKYELWRLVDDDPQRPSLNHILIAGSVQADAHSIGLPAGGYDGLAVSCNGFGLAVIPVMLADDDVLGLLDPAAIREATRVTPKALDVSLQLGPEMVTLIDGSTRPRYQNGLTADDLRYPDIWTVVPGQRPGTGGAIPAGPLFNLNVARLVELIGALGLSLRKKDAEQANVRLSLADNRGHAAIIVEPLGATVGASWLAPFGLLMGLESSTVDRLYFTQDGDVRSRGGWKNDRA